MSPLTFQILLSLKDEPCDAESVVSRIRELQGGEPPISTFYRSLKRAMEEGYLELQEAPDASAAGKRGRPAQRYRITRKGRASLAAEARRLERLARLALAEERDSR